MTEEHWWDLFWSLLWGIWLRRNAWTFNSKRLSVKEVVDRATCCTMEFKEAREGVNVGGARGCHRREEMAKAQRGVF